MLAKILKEKNLHTSITQQIKGGKSTMAKCNKDCFNCKHDDCIVEGISQEERKEIRERDKKLISQLNYGSLAVARPIKAKNKRKYYS